MAALAPALPAPKDWPNGQPYNVVTNTVFEELERQGVVLREACHFAPIEAYHVKGEYMWIPRNEKIWCIPGTEKDIEVMTGCTLAFAALIKTNGDKGTPEIVGYDKGKDHEMWVDLDWNDYDGRADLGGFPTKIIDQYGHITRIMP
ncbi:hypothetical protein FOFC_17941 [Fusarium oxysporum]|nr:hypothetical protein FOFC_17941 [Fusarium oxysporum]